MSELIRSSFYRLVPLFRPSAELFIPLIGSASVKYISFPLDHDLFYSIRYSRHFFSASLSHSLFPPANALHSFADFMLKNRR